METDSVRVRAEQRAARRRLIEDLRASPAPNPLKIAAYGLGAGAGTVVVNGLLYMLLFGVVGTLLHRWKGEAVLTGFTVPLFALFLGSLFWNAIITAVFAVLYHVLCRLFPRAAGPGGGIAFMLAVSLVLQVVGSMLSSPIQASHALRAFGFVSALVSSLIVGAVIGQAELFERKPPLPLGRGL